jgi:hypothetical protein
MREKTDLSPGDRCCVFVGGDWLPGSVVIAVWAVGTRERPPVWYDGPFGYVVRLDSTLVEVWCFPSEVRLLVELS